MVVGRCGAAFLSMSGLFRPLVVCIVSVLAAVWIMQSFLWVSVVGVCEKEKRVDVLYFKVDSGAHRKLYKGLYEGGHHKGCVQQRPKILLEEVY